MDSKNETEISKGIRPTITLNLPKFIVEEEVGLGDVIKHITTSLGIRTCGGCEHRAKILNQWIIFNSNQN